MPLLVIAGKEYGSGSSRDWAAKGTALLGVRAVLAASFERIHRSNLIGMGVLPLQFAAGEDAATLGLTGEETYAVRGLAGAGEVPRDRHRHRRRARRDPRVHRHRPHRHPCRGRLLPARRHPALRAAPPRRPLNSPALRPAVPLSPPARPLDRR